MSSLAPALRDSSTMLRRDLLHAVRNPVTLFTALAFPLIMLLLFVYVLGGAFAVGTDYLTYAVPGILVLGVVNGAGATAVNVTNDLSQGVINRFRTMAISRASVLTGHVVGSFLRTMVCSALVLGLTLLIGFRPNATVGEWFAAAGLVALLVFAVSWLTVALGLVSKTVEGASFAAFPLTFAPFISSAFAPAATMPTPVRLFADNQPFTPVIETVRGLLTGTPIGGSGPIAVAWCVGIALVGYLWARARFRRDPSR